MKFTPEEFYTSFSPRCTYSVPLKHLKHLMLETEGWITWWGQIYDIHSKRLCPGVYKVWGEQRLD
jgi:hypothetical protein